jgi:hypothetical protein
VLPTNLKCILPDQPKSTTDRKIYPQKTNFTLKNYFRHFLCFVAKILAPWRHCLAGHKVLIGTAMQQEKIRHRQEQNGCRQEENKTAKTLCSPARPGSNAACTFK